MKTSELINEANKIAEQKAALYEKMIPMKDGRSIATKEEYAAWSDADSKIADYAEFNNIICESVCICRGFKAVFQNRFYIRKSNKENKEMKAAHINRGTFSKAKAIQILG